MADTFNKNHTEIAQAEHISPVKTGDNIEAKKTALYVWNADVSQWQRMTQPTIDAGDVQIDGVAAFADSGGTDRKGLVDGDRHVQVDVLTSALPSGAATSAKQDTLIGHVDGIEGLLTTIDADTSTLAGAVSGTEMQVDIVSGVQTDALTDTELRATPIDVDTGLTQPLTDTELRATPVDIEGTVTAELSATDNAVLDSIAANQTNGTQKIQIVDSGGEAATVTGGKLDVNATATIDTTGLATESEQEAQTALLTAIEANQLPDGHNVTVDNASIAVTGTFWQATQPISAASLPLPSGAATSANQSTIIGHLDGVEGLLTTIEANQLPDGHNVTIDNPGDIGGGTQYTEGDTDATPTGTVPMWRKAADDSIVSVSDENPLPVTASLDTTGLATESEQEAQTALLTTIDSDTSALAGTVDGTELQVDIVSGVQTDALTDTELRASPIDVDTGLSQPLTDTQLRATPVVVDLGTNNDVTVTGNVAVTNAGLTELAAAINGSSQVDVNIAAGNITGFATSANQTTIIGHLDGIEGSLTAIDSNTDFGAVTGGGTETGALRVTIANNSTGVLSVDDNGSSLTVDGTVAATQSGTWNIGTLTSITNDVSIDDGGNSITVDGTITANLSATDNAVLDSIDANTRSRGSTSAVSSVSGSASSVQLLAANSDRLEAIITNDSTATMYLKLGTTASTTSYTVKLGTDETYITDKYTGRIDAIWSSASGAARITEID